MSFANFFCEMRCFVLSLSHIRQPIATLRRNTTVPTLAQPRATWVTWACHAHVLSACVQAFSFYSLLAIGR